MRISTQSALNVKRNDFFKTSTMSESTVATNACFTLLFDASMKCATIWLSSSLLYVAIQFSVWKFGCNYLHRVIDFTWTTGNHVKKLCCIITTRKILKLVINWNVLLHRKFDSLSYTISCITLYSIWLIIVKLNIYSLKVVPETRKTFGFSFISQYLPFVLDAMDA